MIGGRPLLENTRSRKNTRIAEEELHAGMLEYATPEITDPAEADGKRRKG
jgi:hypothetical protein